jgi:hypothetical protein
MSLGQSSKEQWHPRARGSSFLFLFNCWKSFWVSLSNGQGPPLAGMLGWSWPWSRFFLVVLMGRSWQWLRSLFDELGGRDFSHCRYFPCNCRHGRSQQWPRTLPMNPCMNCMGGFGDGRNPSLTSLGEGTSTIVDTTLAWTVGEDSTMAEVHPWWHCGEGPWPRPKPPTTRATWEVLTMAEILPQWACAEGPRPLSRPPTAMAAREVSTMIEIPPWSAHGERPRSSPKPPLLWTFGEVSMMAKILPRRACWEWP